MEQFLSSISLGFLLRSMFAGVFAVVSFTVSSSRAREFLICQTDLLLPVGLPAALFAGVTIYGLHRSLFYPWIESAMSTPLDGGRKTENCLIKDSTVSYIIKLWDLDTHDEKGSAQNVRARRIFAWADYSHLQYTSGWSIVIGAILGVCTDNNNVQHECCLPLVIMTILFFVAALTSDFRLRYLCHCIQDEFWCKKNGVGSHRKPSTASDADSAS
jgi:hypothetical protein